MLSSAESPIPQDDGYDFRGVSGRITELPFTPDELDADMVTRLRTERFAWLTTMAPTGVPAPMLVWFHFDGAVITVYSPPRAHRVTHIFGHPEVSLHVESDGVGSNILIVGGRASVTAEGVDPRDDAKFWAKYHVEAEVSGIGERIASYSTRITITPTTVWTTHPK